nr:RecName: Full=Purple acid phosphatase isozyme LeSAP2 [Solanum lycopersicum]
FLFVGDL